MEITKKELAKQFAKDWEKHYALKVFKDRGFIRKQCKICGKHFWTVDKDRDVCGDSTCMPYSFIGKKIGWAHDYVDAWREFARFFQKHGRTVIPRYPTIARWRDDTWFVQASIYDFQPHVVSGESAPPANPLVVAQPCFRFNDIENIGVTNRHLSSFVMIGQHNFISEARRDWKDEDVGLVIDCIKHFKIPEKELTFVESVWMGGGNAGPAFEVFVGGMELLTAVFMQYSIEDGKLKELPLKIIDFGWGLERLAWLLNGTYTSYEVIFDPVDKKFAKQIGFERDLEFLKALSKVNSNLDLNETEDIDLALKDAAEKIGIPLEEFKTKIKQLQAFYSILDHSRTLLFALADGALPSNTGGGYNLRVILRRALRLAEEQGWKIDLKWLVREHAQALYGKPSPRVVTGLSKEELLEAQLMPMYPELRQALPDVEKILDVEIKKYFESKSRTSQLLAKILEKKELSNEELIQLYNSHGIFPEDVVSEAAKLGKTVKIPANFYSQLTASHVAAPKKELPTIKLKFKAKGTKPLYYENDRLFEFEAKVLEIVDDRYVVLDKTAFYPTSGGQSCDIGTINDVCAVLDVQKQGQVIIHEVEPVKFKVGEIVKCKIDETRRLQLMRHHTATHILNGICRRELGSHIWQAGAEKTVEKARLDITHYQNLTDEELKKIELLANEVVLSAIPVNKFFLPRPEAEKRYGMRIYQGGAVPGAEIRIVEIPGLDVEACGGIHCSNTLEVGPIKILGSKKIQDGIIRLEFVAGKRAIEEFQTEGALLKEATQIFNVQPEHLPKTCARFFKEWKEQRKEIEKLKKGQK